MGVTVICVPTVQQNPVLLNNNKYFCGYLQLALQTRRYKCAQYLKSLQSRRDQINVRDI